MAYLLCTLLQCLHVYTSSGLFTCTLKQCLHWSDIHGVRPINCVHIGSVHTGAVDMVFGLTTVYIEEVYIPER